MSSLHVGEAHMLAVSVGHFVLDQQLEQHRQRGPICILEPNSQNA